MSLAIQPGATDLLFPLPAPGEAVHPATVHTYYFGATVAEQGIGIMLYLRGQPAFAVAQGGAVVFRGLDNRMLLDAEYHDYRMAMPWPEPDGSIIRVANGLTIEVVEPGELLHVSYTSPDGSVSIDVEQRAISPLVARGYIMPGEDDHHADAAHEPGGIEQFMHATGELVLRDERHEIDCYAVRDRSWRQVRGEDPGGARRTPPLGWTPISYGEEFCLNVTSIEAKDTEPRWLGLFDLPDDAPTHHAGWISRHGETVGIQRVRRNVLEYHSTQHAAVRQELEVTDDTGRVHHFTGEAISLAPVYSWPNITFHDAVYRWVDQHGATTHGDYQEVWFDDYQRAMKARRRS